MKEALRLASVPTVPVSHSVTQQQHPLPQTSRPSPLTFPRLSPIFEPPNRMRRNRRLPRAPHGGKERSCLFRQQSRHRCILWTVLHIDGTRPVSARTGGLILAGERVPSFFVLKSQTE